MPCPRTFAELIDQTWPTAREIHDIETYLDTVAAERGDDWLEKADCKQHWVGAAADIKRLAKKNAAAAPKPRRRRKPAATDRVQLELL